MAGKEVVDKYIPVIGLEVHIQLNTHSKAYSSDANEYGSLPNTLVSPVTLALPGTLPRPNKKAIEFAVRLGLAVQADIHEYNEYARKNYFYADLPKGYQITQDKTPICTGGRVIIKQEDGAEKIIRITRIHMEEDAGKSIHDQDPFDTLIDLNRAGVPLLEMVSEPDIRSAQEAYNYLTEVRKLVRYLDICDGNMEEGSLRCDANISVMLKGSEKYGRRVEVKNMNSIRNVQRAIEHEIRRQVELVEAGKSVDQDTRSFDAVTGTTFSLRSKEAANDYRYFPEPDLQPVLVKKAFIDQVKKDMPPLPDALHKKYVKDFGLSEYDAGVITDNKQFALYFEELTRYIKNYKAAANWMMGTVKSFLNENAIEITAFILKPVQLAALIQLVDEGKVSFTAASQQLFPELVKDPSKSTLQIAEEKNLVQQSDAGSLKEFAEKAIAMYPDKVKEYRSGKTGLIGLFMGEVMKLSKGKADPKVANKIVKELLDAQQV
jgi:aspartyl-tRNA(Asn)/glutamyl-tRNA(Gln) amidotransferase subunit B